MTTVQPFHLHVSDTELADLRRRLARSRLLPDSPRRMSSGMTAAYLAELVDSWIAFDWRAREAWLNRHPQFTVRLDGTELHFAHLRSARPDAPVLLVMHGWPHTFALQLDFADLLDDFHVVLPSFPGYAFSTPYDDRPMTERAIAATIHRLMNEVLGYERYFTYGEDVSANVSELLAATHSESVLGIIATHAHFPTRDERTRLTDETERAFFTRIDADHRLHGSYGHVQATRPDTLAVALNDSPAGLLAWIVEKVAEWSDIPAGDPAAVEQRISRERLLTDVMIYWVTQSIGTSFRGYYEGADTPDPIPPVEVPAAVFIQRHEADYPESLARSYYHDLRVFERLSEGGHFTVAEVPRAMAQRVRAFARDLGRR